MVDVRADAKSERVRPNGAKVAFRRASLCDAKVITETVITLLWSKIGFFDAVC